ncbi:aldo/keto reductase [Kitasatospora sp. NPDC086801]|uniref:aldo/keto reductase n=1 Tax=Kitasatospora sp. NPDC086801 TaxID=3364066 RepID=UPI00381FE8DB
MTARLGLGTYRCLDVAEAALMAASRGADWVDTAPNYAGGRAEASLAVALAAYPDLCVSTKVGFVPAGTRHIGVRAGALSAADAERGHCLTPDYIAWQLARSKLMLSRVPDLVFVHNPEHVCSDGEITGRLYNAFLALEEACSQQTISAYGVATWRGFSSGLFDVPTLIELATRPAGRIITCGPSSSRSPSSTSRPSPRLSTDTARWPMPWMRDWRCSPPPRSTEVRSPAW